MRRIPPARRTGLALVAAGVLLSACGASGGNDSAAPESAAASSSAPGSADRRADPAFCDDAAAIQERVGATLAGQSDPAALAPALREAAVEIRAVEPPGEIAADWNALADGVEQVATALASTDFEDPGGRAAFSEQVGRLQTDLMSSSANVADHLRDECGMGTGAGQPPQPPR